MKAYEKVGNQQKIKDLVASIVKIQRELTKTTDPDVMEDFGCKVVMIEEILSHETDYCSKFGFYESGDYSVGLNACCDHEVWEDKNGVVTDDLNDKMVKQMNNSGECIYFVLKG